MCSYGCSCRKLRCTIRATPICIAAWRDAGWLTLTPGDVVDYRRVTDAILADARQLDIRRLTIDAKFQGVQIAQDPS